MWIESAAAFTEAIDDVHLISAIWALMESRRNPIHNTHKSETGLSQGRRRHDLFRLFRFSPLGLLVGSESARFFTLASTIPMAPAASTNGSTVQRSHGSRHQGCLTANSASRHSAEATVKEAKPIFVPVPSWPRISVINPLKRRQFRGELLPVIR